MLHCVHLMLHCVHLMLHYVHLMLHCFLRALRALAFIDFAHLANIQHVTRPKAARTPILRAGISLISQ